MGLAEYPTGSTLLGMDAQITSTVTRPTPPAALYVDGATKDFVQNEDGSLQEAHPIDAMMFNLCRIATGSLRGATGVGQSLSRRRYLETNMQAVVDDSIRRATSLLVEAGDVTLLRNEVQQSRGRMMVRINYRNNRTGKVENVTT